MASKITEPSPPFLKLQYNPAKVDQAVRDALFPRPEDRTSALRHRRAFVTRDKGVFLPVVVGRLFTTAGDVTTDADGEPVGVAITIHEDCGRSSRKHVSFKLIGAKECFRIEMTNHGNPVDQFVPDEGKSPIYPDQTVQLKDGQAIHLPRGTGIWFRVKMNLECEDCQDEDMFSVVLEEVDDQIAIPVRSPFVEDLG